MSERSGSAVGAAPTSARFHTPRDARFEGYSDDQFRSEMEKIDWFHAIDFGGFQSRGRFAKGAQNKTLLGIFDLLNGLDLKGRNRLDIGTVDGLTAFDIKAKGGCSDGPNREPVVSASSASSTHLELARMASVGIHDPSRQAGPCVDRRRALCRVSLSSAEADQLGRRRPLGGLEQPDPRRRKLVAYRQVSFRLDQRGFHSCCE